MLSRRVAVCGVALGAAALASAAAPSARADIRNFDLAGKIYNKWLYQNDDTQGVVNWGNPFWPENFSGNNGVGSEFELKVMGRVSDAVRAEVRIKSRFGAPWQGWWENGDQFFDELNTSGESLGMNHAEYMKLRGFLIDANLPIPTVRSVLVGSSDLGMFNPWTIGKIRYIDRDNAKGVFITGASDDNVVGYVVAAIALPKLFAGPNWSTGIGDAAVLNPFWTRDWAYGAKLTVTPLDVGQFTLISTITRDHEIDLADPDAEGSLNPSCEDALGNPIPGCKKDNAVETVTRYSDWVSTLAWRHLLFDVLDVEALVAASYQDVNEDVTFNGVSGNAGVFPITYQDTWGFSGKLTLGILDPFEVGLSFRLEGFAIGEDYNSIFGARREADVLLTDGFVEGGQLPTLNIANEFQDFDESWYESCIGWAGLTFVPELELDTARIAAEVTYLDYLTNAQNRDVDETYPDFLHTDGFTDTELYDYANTLDRGRDLRAVFKRNQERLTWIMLLKGRWEPPTDRPFGLDWKLKAILDRDERSLTTKDDDYDGLRLIGRLAGDLMVTDSLKLGLGTQVESWDEKNRRGTLELGYGDDTTFKAKAFASLSYTWSGFNFAYYIEYLYKDQQREREPDQLYSVVRSKATLEVVW